MLQVKTFMDYPTDVDKYVNDFIHDKKVVNILQSTTFNPNYCNDFGLTTVITVVYEEDEKL